jgi:hypothetical protein
MTKLVEARAFAIWRYANRRDWDVSYEEIADATGFERSQVSYIISAKGWGGRIGAGRNGGRSTAAATSMREKSRGNRFDENALDLCQIIGE